MTPQPERINTVGQINALLERNVQVDYQPQERDNAYEFVRRTLVRIGYGRLGPSGKGAVREYLGKTTGLSRAQVTRLIAQYRQSEQVVDRRQDVMTPYEKLRHSAAVADP